MAWAATSGGAVEAVHDVVWGMQLQEFHAVAAAATVATDAEGA